MQPYPQQAAQKIRPCLPDIAPDVVPADLPMCPMQCRSQELDFALALLPQLSSMTNESARAGPQMAWNTACRLLQALNTTECSLTYP